MRKISIKTTLYITSLPPLRVEPRRLLCHLLVCISFLACLVAPAVAQTVAIITDLTGKVGGQGAAAKREVTILSEIGVGSRLRLDGGAHVVVLYTGSGDEYAFNGPALIEFRAGAPETLSGVKPQKQTRAVGIGTDIRIKTASTTQAGYVMRSGRAAAHIKLLSPVGSKTLEIAPEFRWSDVQPGAKYQFDLADETGKALYETRVEGAVLKLPASVALQDGVGYTWEISVRLADGRRYSSAGDFSVATSALRTRVEALRPAVGAPVSERVAYAAWLEQEKLKDEARKYWRALASERPDDARLKELAAE